MYQTLVLAQILLSSLINLQTAYAESVPTTYIAPIVQPQASQPLTGDVSSFMPKLEYCESQDINQPPKIDTDGEYSTGYFQFHTTTFNNYGAYYKLPHDDITSYDEQYAITKAMLEHGLWRQWYNCSKKIGLDKASVSP